MLATQIDDRAAVHRAALGELEKDASELDFEIRRRLNERAQMTETIKLLKTRIEALGGNHAPQNEPNHLGIGPTAFIGMTVRDAIKSLFRDHVKEPLTTAEIKVRLEEGGVRSNGADFLSNVSATLSVMSKTHNEVERDEKSGKWQLRQAVVQDFDPGISDDDIPF